MPRAPKPPDRLPSVEYKGTTIEAYLHHGFSIPDRGPLPPSRTLYAARDSKGERHWRASIDDIETLIDHKFISSAS
jgi:hypothetical protein